MAASLRAIAFKFDYPIGNRFTKWGRGSRKEAVPWRAVPIDAESESGPKGQRISSQRSVRRELRGLINSCRKFAAIVFAWRSRVAGMDRRGRHRLFDFGISKHRSQPSFTTDSAPQGIA